MGGGGGEHEEHGAENTLQAPQDLKLEKGCKEPISPSDVIRMPPAYLLQETAGQPSLEFNLAQIILALLHHDILMWLFS